MLAYLDANSGSLIASAIAAGGAGVAVAAKMKWQQMRKPFSRRGAVEETADVDAEVNAEVEPEAETATEDA